MRIAEHLQKIKNSYLFLVFIAIIVISCSSNYLQKQHKEFDSNNWKIADTAIFHYIPTQLNSPININLEIKHQRDYNFGNLFLFSEINFPDGTTIKDTLQYILINQNNEWIGKGSETITTTFPFKHSVLFPTEGEYTFKFCQAMRVDQDSTLKGINSISLIIK